MAHTVDRGDTERKPLINYQLYLATHAKPFPVSVEYLRQKSGSQAAALREFRRMLKRALGELVVNEDIKDWRIERPNDLVYVHSLGNFIFCD